MTTTSILNPGNGVFGTHVSLEDVNLAIREQMRIDNELTSESKMEVIGDGNGFSSIVILITCQWTTPSEDLPTKIILKILCFEHIKKMVEKAKEEGYFQIDEEMEKQMEEHFEVSVQRIHNQEINVYEVLMKNASESLLTPKVYFTRKFGGENTTKGFIGMEYIEGSGIRHSHENSSLEDIQPILKAIAGIQAMDISEEDLEKIKEGSSFKETAGRMMNVDGMKGIFEQSKKMDPERLTERIERIQSYGSKILDTEMAFNLNKVVAKKSYRMFYPIGGLALIPLFGPAVDMKLVSIDEKKASEYRRVVVEKVTCLLEDVENFYLESIL
uniref:CHK domain-containing protein n=1 Tax=Caenorhabditis tropicalis TaxID=1561998 RepID=A0A1I7UBA5_9PELO